MTLVHPSPISKQPVANVMSNSAVRYEMRALSFPISSDLPRFSWPGTSLRPTLFAPFYSRRR